MNIKNFSILFAFTTLTLFYANSEDYFSSLIGKDKYNKILKEGEVTSVFKKGENLSLIPEISSKTALIREISRIKPTIGVEIILLYKKDECVFDNSNAFLTIYNLLHAISTLEGIEYYSQSRKRMRTFFHKAYAISSIEKKQRIKDPIANVIQATDTLSAFIEDSTFGTYTGQVEYTFDESYFSMGISNASTIWYLLLPVVDPGNLKIYLAVFPYQDTILFYAFTYVNTIDVFNIAESRIPSFYNRLKAMFEWFKSGLEVNR